MLALQLMSFRAYDFMTVEKRRGAQKSSLANRRPRALFGHVIQPRVPGDELRNLHVQLPVLAIHHRANKPDHALTVGSPLRT